MILKLRVTERLLGWLLMASLGLAGPAAAQPPEERSELLRELFPPELLMAHQGELDLTAEQRATITEAIKTMQGEILDLRWQISEEMRRLSEQLRAVPVAEEEALAQADRVMALEQQVKRRHLALLIRIKNQLDPEQRAKLEALRESSPLPPRGPWRRRP